MCRPTPNNPDVVFADGETGVLDVIASTLTRQCLFPERDDAARERIAFFPVTVSDIRNSEYKIKITGVLETGRKATVFLTGVEPFVDVVHSGAEDEATADQLFALCAATRVETVTKRFIRNSGEGPVTRLYFRTLADREDAIVDLRVHHTLASDELYRYYEVAARHYPNVRYSNWVYLPTDGLPHVPIHRVKAVRPSDPAAQIADVLLTATWDIETWNPQNDPNEDGRSCDSVVHTICSTLHSYRKAEPLASVVFCLASVDASEYSELVAASDVPVGGSHFVFTLGSQQELIRCFIAYLESAEPDFIAGFNDSFYDWKFLQAKIEMLGLFDGGKRSIFFNNNVNVKIPGNIEGIRREEAGTVISKAGLVPIDVRTRYRIKFPKESKSSLAHFLSMVDKITGTVGKKVDLPYATMHKYFADLVNFGASVQSARNFAAVAFYCLVDAFMCQRLLVYDATIDFYRPLVDRPRMSLHSAHYHANSSKITNLVCIEAMRRNIVVGHNISASAQPSSSQRKKYEGGYVREPVAGVNKSVPVFALDYTSLYPSEIIANNISIDTVVDDAYEGATHDAHISDTEVYRFKSHEQNIEKYGIVPRVLSSLLDERLVVKRELAEIDRKLERLAEGANEPAARALRELRVVKNAEQLVKKIFMNTVYGTLGAAWHPLYHKGIASSVTFFGRRDLRLAIAFVESLGYTVYYGDTDSMYVGLLPSQVSEVRAETAAQQRETLDPLLFPSNLVRRAFTVAAEVGAAVNEHLFLTYGHRTLTMEYEEVLFPVVFCQKKNYFGLCHKSTVSMVVRPDYGNVFARGIQIVQRTTCAFTAEFNKNFITRILSVTNTDSIMDVFLHVVDWAVSTRHDMPVTNFYLNKVYRPYKEVLDVNAFIRRLRETRPEAPIPIPGERFEFVLVNRPVFTEKGTKNNLKIGDLMEYPDYVVNGVDDINVPMYIIRSISTIANIVFLSEEEGEGDNRLSESTVARTKTRLEKIVKELCSAAGMAVYTPTLAKAHRTAVREQRSLLVSLNGAHLKGFPTSRHQRFWRTLPTDRLDVWLALNAKYSSPSVVRGELERLLASRLSAPTASLSSLSRWAGSVLVMELYMLQVYAVVKAVRSAR